MTTRAKKKIKLKPYSVLLLYPDYMTNDYPFQTYYQWVKARGPKSAVKAARKMAVEGNEDANIEHPTDFALLLCVRGHIEAELDSYTEHA